MAVMDEERLSNLLKQALADRLEGWELVEFLQIDIETIIDNFEEAILDNLEDVCDFAGIRNNDDEGE
jgi:hypothetical protein